MLLIVNMLLRTDALLRLYAMLNQYVYDVLENSTQLTADKAELEAAIADPERKDNKEYLNKLVQKIKAHEDNAALIWYKTAYKSRYIARLLELGFGLNRWRRHDILSTDEGERFFSQKAGGA